jgi:CRISPR-associated endonuclease/helicase Cas3
MKYYGHSGRSPDRSDWQTLPSHLVAVGALTAERAAFFGAGPLGSLTGLLHDLGKYTAAFDARLSGGKAVDHSTAGAFVALQLAATPVNRMFAQLAAYCIAGHHTGLPDKRGIGGTLSDRLERFVDTLDPVWKTELDVEATGLAVPLKFIDGRQAFQLAFLGRMLFSCLIDADRTDTQQFYAALDGLDVDRNWSTLQEILPDLLARLDARFAAFAAKAEPGPIDALRADILKHVRDRADQAPGFFTLTVPTGGGKTLASLAFALDHARLHGHRRIIYAIPFTSIIDQTATTFKDILGADTVLEHHSAIEEESTEPAERSDQDRLRMAMEDWAAPIVVTTNVQFFETLFAARTSRARKLHNIAGSVIILDEAQTLPRHLLAPAARALHELALNYQCTIVLCTATQPALDAGRFPQGHPVGLPLEGRELAPDPTALSRRLTRVTIAHGGAMADDALVAALRDTPQGLVIVNTRKHALALYRCGVDAGLDGMIHLTTRQCAAHRRQILADIRARLKADRPCRVIATSLIEAGVDVDFPRIWRAEAGLDQIAQAAGRCNREGRRPIEDSVVTVFTAPDNPPPRVIEQLTQDMKQAIGKHDDLLSPAAMEDYFGEVYWRVGDGLDEEKILDQFRMSASDIDIAYRTIAEKFRMIEDGMATVIIAYDDKARDTLARLESNTITAGAAARALQTYTVQVPPNDRAKLLANGHARMIRPDVFKDQFIVLKSPALYRAESGLIWEEADSLGIGTSVI